MMKKEVIEMLLNKKNKRVLVLMSLFSVSFLAVGFGLFEAGKVLGLSSAVAGSLYYALMGIQAAAVAAAIVSSFGIGTVAVGAIIRAVGGYTFKGFVSW